MIWDIHILISNTIFRKDSVRIGMQGMCFITLYMDSELRVHCIVGYKLTFTHNLSHAMHTTERFTYCILYAEIAWWHPSIKKLTLIELSTQMNFFYTKSHFKWSKKKKVNAWRQSTPRNETMIFAHASWMRESQMTCRACDSASRKHPPHKSMWEKALAHTKYCIRRVQRRWNYRLSGF